MVAFHKVWIRLNRSTSEVAAAWPLKPAAILVQYAAGPLTAHWRIRQRIRNLGEQRQQHKPAVKGTLNFISNTQIEDTCHA